MAIKRITIIEERKKPSSNINEELQWISKCLGMFNERDKESSQFRIFIELLKAKKDHDPLSSEELARRSHLTRGTVVHHLIKLGESGIVSNKKNRYFIREKNLFSLMDELENSLSNTFRELKKIARKIDREMEL